MKKYIVSMVLVLAFTINAFAQKVDILPMDLNTSSDDFAPALTQNNRLMYFTSDRYKGKQRVFVVERTSSGWSTPEQLKNDINDAAEAGSVALTSDGQFMVFAAFKHDKKGLGRTDLYSARKVFGVWTDIQNLGSEVNSDAWDAQPVFSSDGKTLFFVSDRDGGFGGTDIYMTTMKGEKWTKAVNIGSTINTASDEMTPQIGADMKTFTFASNRSGGFGGFDIYVTRFQGNTFSTPKNAEQPINSSADDLYYVTQANSNIAYFSSNRSGGNGELDIYMAVPNPYESDAVLLVQGTVRDKSSNDPIGSKITVTDLRTGKKVSDMRSDDVTGNYYVVLQPGSKYSITAQKPGYVFYSERIDVPLMDKGKEETKDIYLTKMDEGSTRLLIFFDFNKTDLQDESIPELERTIEFLKENPNIKVQLVGHTDDVGSDDYNDKLSHDRASSAKKYLVNAGIEASRISTMGKGKRSPLIKGTSDEARAANRRVEMIILK